MSYWMKLGVTITNLEVFKNNCGKHGIEYVANTNPNYLWRGAKVVATLRDTRSQGTALLIEEKGGIRMAWDSDVHYNPMARRLGANGGILTRDYATDMVRKNIMKNGGMVESMKYQDDGSVILKAAVGA